MLQMKKDKKAAEAPFVWALRCLSLDPTLVVDVDALVLVGGHEVVVAALPPAE